MTDEEIEAERLAILEEARKPGGPTGGYLALIERDKVNRRHMMANHKRRVTAIKATMAQAKAEPPTIDVTLAANATEAT